MQLPTKKIELDQLHWACYLTEPIPVHTKTDPLERESLAHLQLNESKVRLSCSSDFDLKKSENVQHMMRRMNTWLARIRTRSQLKQTLHWTHAKIVDSYRRHTAEGTLPVV